MTLKNTIYILITCTLLLAACTRSMSREELVEYASKPKNGLVQEKSIHGITYKLSYRPVELMVAQHIKANSKLTKEEVELLRKQYNEQHYFMLSISQGKQEALKGARDFQQFSNLVQTMAFGMGKYATLSTAERDTLPLIDSHFARYFGMGSSNDIMLVFQKEENKTKKYTFQLNEFGLNTGDTRFYFYAKNINRLQKIRIKKI